jgi:hypothetical protein
MDIRFTLDYELFLGDKTGTIEKCLIEPMEALRTVINKKGIKITLFVDAAYLLRLRSLSNISELNKGFCRVCSYLEELSKDGHELQFHFHPQWLYSDFKNGGWSMDLDHYKLSDVEEDYLQESFSEALGIVRSVSRNVVNAYRAGGYSIQTYNNLKTLFLKNEIKIDSSVMPGGVELEEKHYYDFRRAPQKSHWKFSTDVVNEDQNGPFIEIPITTQLPKTTFHYLYLKRELSEKHGQFKVWGDGKSIDTTGSRIKRITDKVNKFFRPCVLSASIDNVMSENLINIYQTNPNDCLTIIGHPKNFTNKSIQNVATFINLASKDCFKTISDINFD